MQFQALDCVVMPHDGTSFLKVDSDIDCKSSSYRTFQALVCCFVVIYQGIPFVWFLLLRRVRDKLDPIGDQHRKHQQRLRQKHEHRQGNPNGNGCGGGFWGFLAGAIGSSGEGEFRAQEDGRSPQAVAAAAATELSVVQEQRKKDPELQMTRFLWMDYLPSCWAFECAEMQRRILFIGVLPLLGDGAFRACVGLFISIVAAVFIRETSPFIRDTTKSVVD